MDMRVVLLVAGVCTEFANHRFNMHVPLDMSFTWL